MSILEKIITKIELEHPYKVPGNPDSYSSYCEAWQDCCDRFRQMLDVPYIHVGKWTSVTEKLPDMRQDVLTSTRYSGFMGMHGYWHKTGHIENDGSFWGDCMGGEVVAWMELPPIYRKDNQDE